MAESNLFHDPEAFPGSSKHYETGYRDDIRVGMRSITLADSQLENGSRRNDCNRTSAFSACTRVVSCSRLKRQTM